MSHLIVYELKTTREQTIVVNEDMLVKTIRLNLYRHLNPAGSLILTVKNGSTTVATKTVAISLLDSTNYSHGFYSFEFDTAINLTPATYTLELSSSGYTFDDAAYVGWIKEHENNTNNFTSTISNYFDNPFSFQIWEYKK